MQYFIGKFLKTIGNFRTFCGNFRGYIGNFRKYIGNFPYCIVIFGTIFVGIAIYNLIKTNISMLTLNLKPIFTARGIEAPLKFLMKNGIPRDAAFSLIHEHKPNIKLAYIERLCEILFCELSDLFLWQPDRNVRNKEEHPLFPLFRPEGTTTDFKTLLANVPYKKLNDLSAALAKEIEDKET